MPKMADTEGLKDLRLFPDTQSFEDVINQCFYIDKTRQIYSLLKTHKQVLLTRPKRFGKSLLVNSIAAVFQGNYEIFSTNNK